MSSAYIRQMRNRNIQFAPNEVYNNLTRPNVAISILKPNYKLRIKLTKQFSDFKNKR